MTSPFERYCPYCFEPIPDRSGCADPRCHEIASWHPGDSLPIGTELCGRYVVGRRDGRHYSETQYLAWDQLSGFKVQIRECTPSRLVHRASDGLTMQGHGPKEAATFATGCRMFVRDAMAFSGLAERLALVPVRAVLQENGTAYAVTDFVGDPTLDTVLAAMPGGRLSYPQAVRLLLPVVHALRAMHENGTLHYRVQPDEIVVDRDGKGRLNFVGASRMWLAWRHIGTDDPPRIGPYGPPEESGSRPHETCSDVYSLAATFYRTVTGLEPLEALERLVNGEELISPSRLGIPLPRGIEPALMQALELDRGARMQTLDDLVAAFNEAPASAFDDTRFEPPPVLRSPSHDGSERQP